MFFDIKDIMTNFSKETWIKKGLKVLAESGAASLTIKGLSFRLNVTKGSFYHHFKNRIVFINEMLEYWENQLTYEN